MPRGIFLTITDVQLLKGYESYKSAWAFYRRIRRLTGKPDNALITISDFCEVTCCTDQDVIKFFETKKVSA